MNRKWPIGLAVVVLTGCGGVDPTQPTDQEAGTVREEFRGNVLGWHYPGTSHASITEAALPFLDDDLESDLESLNEDTDKGDTQTDSKYHMDNCRLTESFASVRDRYTSVVNGLGDGLGFGALRLFGTILHTTQDFYSHSNWVDAYQAGILTEHHAFEFPSATPASFFGTPLGSMVALEVGVPDSWVVSLAKGTRVPDVATDWGVVSGLITGTYDNTDGPSACPSTASIPHGPFFTSSLAPGSYLSKDDPDSIHHKMAVDAAKRQTTEEFCRLGRLLLLRKGVSVYEGVLHAWVSDRGQYEAACPNTRGQVTALTSVVL